MSIYRISQTVLHVITVRADNEEDAYRFADNMGDDDFADLEWGGTNIEKLPATVTEADQDITS